MAPVDPRRIEDLNGLPPEPGGRFVLYWMQAAQRAAHNPALEHAVAVADGLGQGVVVGFGLTDGYPEANLRHHAFMLEGLGEAAATLRGRGIRFVLRRGDPPEVALGLAREGAGAGASVVVCDVGYTRFQRAWRERVAREAGRRVVSVEGEVVVPVGLASPKAEIGARTLRPKILRLREEFLRPLEEARPRVGTLDLPGLEEDLDPAADVEGSLRLLRLDRSVPPSARFRGGTAEARARLDRFVANLAGYAGARSDPASRHGSRLSPYLQFGQISPVEAALRACAAAPAGDPDRAAFLEELVVRRELAHNLLRYAAGYDSLDCVPGWARATLDKHRKDRRGHVYDEAELETGRTHDPYYNAAMREMRVTGYMQGHMRMYWGKKILEYSESPEAAFAATLRLNNRHFLCGRGANAFANVAWVFGLHDRPWVERPVFGQVRYMNGRGLERKFDIAAYVRWTEELEG
jgi:deoxyribodipyrimidine photo-lyase